MFYAPARRASFWFSRPMFFDDYAMPPAKILRSFRQILKKQKPPFVWD
jgi:hypothetical protein